MAEIQQSGGNDGGKKRAKKQSTRVDMTPLVDLAFLLLTFFVLTSTFSKPKVLRMIFPEKLDQDNPQLKRPEVKDGLTILLTGNNKIYYYTGSLKAETEIIPTDFTKNGLRKVLIEKNAPLIKILKDYKNKTESKSQYIKRVIFFSHKLSRSKGEITDKGSINQMAFILKEYKNIFQS